MATKQLSRTPSSPRSCRAAYPSTFSPPAGADLRSVSILTNSPYAFSENKVIDHVELEGLEAAAFEIRSNALYTGYLKGTVTEEEIKDFHKANFLGAATGALLGLVALDVLTTRGAITTEIGVSLLATQAANDLIESDPSACPGCGPIIIPAVPTPFSWAGSSGSNVVTQRATNSVERYATGISGRNFTSSELTTMMSSNSADETMVTLYRGIKGTEAGGKGSFYTLDKAYAGSYSSNVSEISIPKHSFDLLKNEGLIMELQGVNAAPVEGATVIQGREIEVLNDVVRNALPSGGT